MADWNSDMMAFPFGHYGEGRMPDGAVVSIFRDWGNGFHNVMTGARLFGLRGWRKRCS